MYKKTGVVFRSIKSLQHQKKQCFALNFCYTCYKSSPDKGIFKT